jgi:hypothetical protein
MSARADKTHQILEQLTGLYQTDPVEFDRISRELIADTIASFPEHHRRRAQGLQFRLDAILSHYHHPVARMNKMVEIFWEHFWQFHDALVDPERFVADRARNSKAPGRIIQLPIDPERAGKSPAKPSNQNQPQ